MTTPTYDTVHPSSTEKGAQMLHTILNIQETELHYCLKYALFDV